MSWFKKKKQKPIIVKVPVTTSGRVAGPIIPKGWGKGNPYALSGTCSYSSMPMVSSTVTFWNPRDLEDDDAPPDYNGDGVFNSDDLKEFEKKVKVTLADGHEVEVTAGEYYEINKMGKNLKDMNIEEYSEALMAVRL